jgi:hypothetical protein
MSRSNAKPPVISDELVMRKIHTIRGLKVMLDRDLAELYGVPTKALKQAVRRIASSTMLPEFGLRNFEVWFAWFGLRTWAAENEPVFARLWLFWIAAWNVRR